MITELNQKEFVRYQSRALTLRLGRFIWQMHVISSVLLVAVLWSSVQLELLIAWSGLMIALAIVQAAICFRGAALADNATAVTRYATAFSVTAIFLAIGWSWFIFSLIPGGDPEIRNFIGFVIGGALLTVTGTQNLHYPLMAITLVLIVSAQCYRLLIDVDNAFDVLAVGMLIIFAMLMLGLGWMLRSITRQGFALQWDKAMLAKKLELQADALEKARTEADAANDAKSRFLAQASHDLRQPIHSMGLHLASLSGEKLTVRTRMVMTRISQSVEVLSKLFNSLLDVTLLDTRQLAPKASAFNLGALIGEISDEFSLAAEAENVVLKPNREYVFINSDVLIVRRILQNLVSNAIRHTDGGSVDIYAHKNEDGVFLVVKDTGRGIAKADQAKIFEEFSKAGTVTDAAEGLGLGLAIVRRLSQALNVIIDFSSQEGNGTQFSIGPFASANETVDGSSGIIKIQRPHFIETNGRVTIIDDDKATLEATAALLSNWGWEIDARTHMSVEDIAKLPQPDLIISDYDLGFGRTGLDTVSEIRSAHGDIPALIITGSSNVDIRKEILQAGYVILHKPVRPVQLRSAILGVLN